MDDGTYGPALDVAVQAAQEAGALLSREFHRPDGPRGAIGSCPADVEAEALIRDRLEGFDESYGVIGEELPDRDRRPREAHGHVWLVDPNDGTAYMQRGWRGAAVSIGLVLGGEPVLGVVLAYDALAGRGDLLTWAEGAPLCRNGEEVHAQEWGTVTSSDTVLVSPAADGAPTGNTRACLPARYRPIASVAYRFALVAAGEGVAGVSGGGPTDYDVAAGHALVRAMGGELYDWQGEPVRYGSDGHAFVGNCAAGHPVFARELVRRRWPHRYRPGASLAPEPPALLRSLGQSRPSPTVTVADPDLLDRAQGVLLGQLAGDALGSLVEFRRPEEVRARYGDGPLVLEDGGTFSTIAGQPTDDSEMALCLARSLLARGAYDAEAVARSYAGWFDSGPFDMGNTTHTALSPASRAARDGEPVAAASRDAAATHDSEANGALMRVSPLAIFAHGLGDDRIAELARADARLTHAADVPADANAVFCVALAAALREGLGASDTYEYAVTWAREAAVDAKVAESLRAAAEGPPPDFMKHQGWVLTALRNAFHRLLVSETPHAAVVDTVREGGDTYTNAAVVGALVGGVHGAAAFPHQWADRVATCRPLTTPDDGAWRTTHPRPAVFWPADYESLAEHLVVVAGSRRSPGG